MKRKLCDRINHLAWEHETFRRFCFWTLKHPTIWKLCWGWLYEKSEVA